MLQRTGAIWQLNSLRIWGCRLPEPGALARNVFNFFSGTEREVNDSEKKTKNKQGLLEIDQLRVSLIKQQRNSIEFI